MDSSFTIATATGTWYKFTYSVHTQHGAKQIMVATNEQTIKLKHRMDERKKVQSVNRTNERTNE